MKRAKLLVIFALVLTFALSSFAARTTVTGILTDEMCTKKHMISGRTSADCVRECVKHGAKYVLVSQGKVIGVEGKKEELNALAGKKITVTGEFRGQVLVLGSVEAAQ